jgi:hypothetical protein
MDCYLYDCNCSSDVFDVFLAIHTSRKRAFYAHKASDPANVESPKWFMREAGWYKLRWSGGNIEMIFADLDEAYLFVLSERPISPSRSFLIISVFCNTI